MRWSLTWRADWLPFLPFRQAKSIARGEYREVAFVQRSGSDVAAKRQGNLFEQRERVA